MLTLRQLQRVPFGTTLTNSDLAYANELLRTHTPEFVWKCVRGWAQEYARVERCDGLLARDFERNAY